MRLALVSTLLAAFGLATPAWGARPQRVATIVIPIDKASEPLTLKLERFVNEALREYPSWQVKTSDDLFGLAVDEQAQAALKRADAWHLEAQALFEATRREDAEQKLRATIKEYTKAASAMKTCGPLCDSVAMLAATLLSRGNAEEAKFVMLDLISLGNPALDPKRFGQDFQTLKAQVSGSRNAQLRGSLTVTSHPAGGRLFVNGELQGFTPMTLPTLPTGQTLIRVDRPGFKSAGAVVEMGPDEQEVTLDLVATQAYKNFNAQCERLATEAMKEKGAATLASVGKALNLDRAVIALLRNDDAENELWLGYYELKSGRRLGFKRNRFHGDEYGQLQGEVGRMVTQLINAADGSDDKPAGSSDPLERKSGSEEWNAEDKGGRSTSKEKQQKKKGDPLEGMQGTEEW